MRFVRPGVTVAAVSIFVVTWLGCSDKVLTPEPASPEERVHSLQVGGRLGAGWVGMIAPIDFMAVDSAGEGVAGVSIDLHVVMGGGTFSAPSVLTDSSGKAHVDISLHSEGWFQFGASIRGTPVTAGGIITVDPRPRVEFTQDTALIAGIGCRSSLYAQVLNDRGSIILASSVLFEAKDSAIVSFTPLSFTANYREMWTGLIGEKAGTTTVIGTHGSGAADTATVTVLPGSLSQVAIVDAERLHGDNLSSLRSATPFVGDTLRWALRTVTPCDGYLPDIPVDWSSTDPAVATVDRAGVVVIHAHGHALVIGSAGELADTASVTTIQVEPRDTVIAVGDTVQYRMSFADTTGTLHPSHDLRAEPVIAPGSVEIASPVLVDDKPSTRVVGLRPGSARVHITSGSPWRSAYVTLTVADP